MRKEINPIDKALGEELKSIRLERGMTLQEVADRLGCSRPLMYYYEQGRASISVPQLIKLCDIYGIYYADILDKVRAYVYKH